ncbi:MAG: metallophosphoesterase [Bacteroidota bacterium]
MRTFVVGDIHGAHKALVQVMERSGFDREQDRLISLGDLTDYNPDSAQVIEELLGLKHLIAVRGNHDVWMEAWLKTKDIDPVWLMNGGSESIVSYRKTERQDDPRHVDFFARQIPYYLDESNRLYVHAGFDPDRSLESQSDETLYWSRAFWTGVATAHNAGEAPRDFDYAAIFIGHTPTPKYFRHFLPVNCGSVWNLDQGAKSIGVLTLMEVETKAYWQSDRVSELYR